MCNILQGIRKNRIGKVIRCSSKRIVKIITRINTSVILIRGNQQADRIIKIRLNGTRALKIIIRIIITRVIFLF